MTSSRLKVVLICPACDGTDVGEAWSGFQWAHHLSRICDLTVLTYRKGGRPAIAPQLPHAEVVEWRELSLTAQFERFNSIVKPAYVPFYLQARRWLKRERRSGRIINIVHQVSPLAIRYPSPAVGLGLPFVLGPLAGGLETPEAFKPECRKEPVYMRLRALDGLRLNVDPFLRRSLRDAAVVIGVAPYVADILQAIPLKRFVLMSETGVLQLPALPDEPQASSTLRLLYVGRIVRTKGVRDAVRALGQLPSSCNASLDIVGDGEDRVRCEEEAQALGLRTRVRFHGRRPREEVDHFYRQADVFLFPSFREPSGNVVLEAMSFGLPMIVADRGGPGHVVNDNNGIRVPVTTPSEYPRQIARAIERLAEDSILRRHMGTAAREQIRSTYLWEKKAERMATIYEDVCEQFAG